MRRRGTTRPWKVQKKQNAIHPREGPQAEFFFLLEFELHACVDANYNDIEAVMGCLLNGFCTGRAGQQSGQVRVANYSISIFAS